MCNTDLYSSVQFSSRWHLCAREEFPQCCLQNRSNVGLTDDGPFTSSQGRSSFYASLLQATDGEVYTRISKQHHSFNISQLFFFISWIRIDISIKNNNGGNITKCKKYKKIATPYQILVQAASPRSGISSAEPPQSFLGPRLPPSVSAAPRLSSAGQSCSAGHWPATQTPVKL